MHLKRAAYGADLSQNATAPAAADSRPRAFLSNPAPIAYPTPIPPSWEVVSYPLHNRTQPINSPSIGLPN